MSHENQAGHEQTVPLQNYSAALDEIYALRLALAYEARVVEAHYEGYKTFPKTRRRIAEEQVARMRQAVTGTPPWLAYAGQGHLSREYSRLRGKRVGDATMTRHEWEQERGLR